MPAKKKDNLLIPDDERSKKSTFTQAKPMFAKTAGKPFDDPDWLFEIKLDGYRILAHRKGNNTDLISRNGINYNDSYKTIYKALASIDHDFIIDGEMAVVDSKGRTDFSRLQHLSADDFPTFAILFSICCGSTVLTSPNIRSSGERKY